MVTPPPLMPVANRTIAIDITPCVVGDNRPGQVPSPFMK
jgi:hypothetical protein